MASKFINRSKEEMRQQRKIVELLVDMEEVGLKKGDRLEVTPHWCYPDDKYTVIRRVPDGYDPKCHVYPKHVRVIR